MPVMISVFGRKKSGKTSVIEALVKLLASDKIVVDVAKHVHDPEFTIDTPGKDSWRFSEAGARWVYVFSAREAAIIEKHAHRYDEDSLLSKLSDGRSDVVILEGFHHLLSKSGRVGKIVVGANGEDVSDLLAACQEPVLGCVITSPEPVNLGVKVYRYPGDLEALARDIKSLVSR